MTSTAKKHGLGQNLIKGFAKPESYFKSPDKIDEIRISNLAKEPNPFEQSFSKSTLIKQESQEITNNSNNTLKPTLPSIASIGQGPRFLPNEPIKLSPIILDPSTYGKSQPVTYHSYQNTFHPPIMPDPIPSPLSQTVLPPQPSRLVVPRVNDPAIVSNPPYTMEQMAQTTLPPAALPKPSSYMGSIPLQAPSVLPVHTTEALPSYPFNPTPMVPNDPLKCHIPMIPPPLYPSTNSNTKPKKSAGGRKRLPTDGMSAKKIDFLERNRKAALKCRQRKKDEYRRVEESVRILNVNNNMLTNDLQYLTQEAMKLRALLITHGPCPVAQAAGVLGESTLPQPTQIMIPPQVSAPSY